MFSTAWKPHTATTSIAIPVDPLLTLPSLSTLFPVCRSGGQSKQGRGKFSFGSPDQEAEQAAKDPSSAEVPVEEDAVEEVAVVEAEPEIPTKSMEEFLAERAAKKAAVAALAGAKKERKVEAVAITGKNAVDELLASNKKAADAAKVPSARKAATVKVDIAYGFRTEGGFEDRPPREFNADRPPREFNADRPPREFNADRPPRAPREGGDRAPREDRPPRAPREEGDRPPRAPRKEGDNKDRPPRRENNRDGARPAKDATSKPRGDFQQRSKGPQVNLKDAEAFPAL